MGLWGIQAKKKKIGASDFTKKKLQLVKFKKIDRYPKKTEY